MIRQALDILIKNVENNGMKITTAVFFLIVLTFLQGCASSDAARGAASEADQAYLQTDYSVRHFTDSGISETYQNTSQMAKGVIIGGTIVAPNAADMVAELSLAVRSQMTAKELAAVPHAFLSWSEAIRVAANKLS